MIRSLMFLFALAVCAGANAQEPLPYNAPGFGGGGFGCNTPAPCRPQQQPTVCCRKYWDPYAFSQTHWDPCWGWVTCWYGGWKTECKRPCNSGGVPYQGMQQASFSPAAYPGGPY